MTAQDLGGCIHARGVTGFAGLFGIDQHGASTDERDTVRG